jgi:RES domain-containing protein
MPALYGDAGTVPTQDSGRWNQLGISFAQYMSLEPMGSWAELARYENVTDPAEAQSRTHRRNLWLVFIKQRGIADLSTFHCYEACGLDPAMAVSSDYQRTQDLRFELEDAGFTGVLSPSAAHPVAVNLTLFGERRARQVDNQPLEKWPNRRPGQLVPVKFLAEDAPLPTKAIEQAVLPGDLHSGYAKWRATSGRKTPGA